MGALYESIYCEPEESLYISATLLYNLGLFLFHGGSNSSAKAVLNIAHEMFDQQKDLGGRVDCLSAIGDVLGAISDLEGATEYTERVLNIVGHEFGRNTPRFASALNNLGEVSLKQGNFNKALDCFRESLVIWKELRGDCSVAVANCYKLMGDLAQSLHSFAEAKVNYAESLRINKVLLGPFNFEVATSTYCVGAAECSLKNYDRALELIDHSLHIFVSLVGSFHPMVATVLSHKSEVFMNLKKYDEAGRLVEICIELHQRLYNKPHVTTAGMVHNLGVIRLEQDDYVCAKEYLQKAVDMYEAVGVPFRKAISLHQLGYAIMMLGNKEEAIAAFQSSLEIGKKALGEHNKQLSRTLHWLVELHGQLNDTEKQALYMEEQRKLETALEFNCFPALS